MRKSNYDKMPATVVDGTLWKGWESIRKRLAEIHAETNGSQVWVVECYQGVHHEELMRELQALAPDRFINTRDLFKSAEVIVDASQISSPDTADAADKMLTFLSPYKADWKSDSHTSY